MHSAKLSLLMKSVLYERLVLWDTKKAVPGCGDRETGSLLHSVSESFGV